MSWRITTLMENTSPSDRLVAQHGLALLVEGPDRRLIYDTGPSPRFLFNARALGADIAGADALILSHSHWDHTGGAAALLAGPFPPKALYVGRGFFNAGWRKLEEGRVEVGSLLDPATVRLSGVDFHEVGAEPVALGTSAWAVSGFRTTDPRETPPPVYLRQTEEGLVPETFSEEVVLVLRSEDGLTVVSGCSHTGIVSICCRVRDLFAAPVVRFVGGTHLISADDARIAWTCEKLREIGLRRLGACHCTGRKAEAFFAARFPGFYRNNIGTVTDIA